MKIKYLRAKNFLAVTDGPFEIDFTKHEDVVQIKGYNWDYGKDHSNGSGKTSCIEAIVYAFYGKLIKGITHKEAINVKTKKGLEVEIHFDDYRIIRKRKPDELRLWKGDDELTLGGIPATQDAINKIIGLNWNSFSNVVCFGQHNEKSFLRCDASEKREIAENLLSLDRYVKYCDTAKKKKSVLQDKIKQLSLMYQQKLREHDSANKKLESLMSRQQQWQQEVKQEINRLEQFIKDCNNSLKSDKIYEDYKSAQLELEQIDKEIHIFDKQKSEISVMLEQVEEHIDGRSDRKRELASLVSELDSKINRISSDISDNQKKNDGLQKNYKCPLCKNSMSEDSIKSLSDSYYKAISTLTEELISVRANKDVKLKELTSVDNGLNKLLLGKKDIKLKESETTALLNKHLSRKSVLLKVPKPSSSESLIIDNKIQNALERIELKKNEKDPCEELIILVEKEIKEAEEGIKVHKEELKSFERLIPYYDYLIRAFGDDGIRSFVIDEVVPILNSKINYWLQFLIDNKISLEFNNQLEEKIERFSGDGNPFVYFSLSGGEHQRIDLAISLAFSQVMMLTSGTCPSIIALDEIGTNLDVPGIYAVYKTICELSKDRQVLVTTHHPVLQELLISNDLIEVEMRDGVTTIRK